MTPRALILGLDASPRRIGWALVDHDSGQPLHADTIHVAANDDLRARRAAFLEIARATDARGDLIITTLEDAHAGPNRRGSLIHAMSIGNLEAWAIARWPSSLVDRIQPSAWRRELGLPMRGKEPLLAWARTTSLAIKDQDAADALGIATATHKLAWRHAA